MNPFILCLALLVTHEVMSQKPSDPCCSIIDLNKEGGTFTIRDRSTGRIQLFKPDALEGAELKVGDTVDADFGLKKVISVKGISKSYDLLDAAQLDSSCTILKIDTLENSVGHIVALNNKTGEKIRFNLPMLLANRLAPGSIVFTQPSHGYAMIAAAEADSTQRILFGFPFLQETAKESK